MNNEGNLRVVLKSSDSRDLLPVKKDLPAIDI